MTISQKKSKIIIRMVCVLAALQKNDDLLAFCEVTIV